jgi:Uma2 family endonuclease
MSREAMSTQTTQQELQAVLLDLLPPQGGWEEAEYLWLTDRSNRLLELSDGIIEVLPMPTREHQTIVGFLYVALLQILRPLGADVLFAPLRLRVRAGKFREPDLLAVLDTNDPRAQNRYWTGADLVVEVVCPDAPERDLVEKRREYAAAGIPEYWIVDPRDRSVTVLTLADDEYQEHGRFLPGQEATSVLLPDFTVTTAAIFGGN